MRLVFFSVLLNFFVPAYGNFTSLKRNLTEGSGNDIITTVDVSNAQFSDSATPTYNVTIEMTSEVNERLFTGTIPLLKDATYPMLVISVGLLVAFLSVALSLCVILCRKVTWWSLQRQNYGLVVDLDDSNTSETEEGNREETKENQQSTTGAALEAENPSADADESNSDTKSKEIASNAHENKKAETENDEVLSNSKNDGDVALTGKSGVSEGNSSLVSADQSDPAVEENPSTPTPGPEEDEAAVAADSEEPVTSTN